MSVFYPSENDAVMVEANTHAFEDFGRGFQDHLSYVEICLLYGEMMNGAEWWSLYWKGLLGYGPSEYLMVILLEICHI